MSTHLKRLLFFNMACMVMAVGAKAQLKAYGGRSNDNNCKIVYLVNPASDSIYYIAGLKQKDLKDCQTFANSAASGSKVAINVSTSEKDYLLLLPKDTIAYNILVSSTDNAKDKELSVLLRISPDVININNDKKRNRQIARLPMRRIVVPIIEK